jgi:hypothetical protein
MPDSCGFLIWGALSAERKGLSFKIAAGPRQSSPSPAGPQPVFYYLNCQVQDFLNLEGQVPVFISPRNWVAQLHPQALSSLFVASYDS